MKLDLYLVIGAGGIVGRQIVEYLQNLNKTFFYISAKNIVRQTNHNTKKTLNSFFNEKKITKTKNKTVAVLLCHRCRSPKILVALKSELSITRDLIWGIASKFKAVRASVIGSVTGEKISLLNTEAYHYTKDLQKSIVRQSVRKKNLSMNLIEINWFKKYEQKNWSKKYKKALTKIQINLGKQNLPSAKNIGQYACSVMELDVPPRGQILKYDGGYDLLQK